MSSEADDTVPDYQRRASHGREPDPKMAVVSRAPAPTYASLPPPHSNIVPSTSRYLDSQAFLPINYMASSPQVPLYTRPRVPVPSNRHTDRSRPRHVPLPSYSGASVGTLSPHRPTNYRAEAHRDIPIDDGSNHLRGLSNYAWIEQALQAANRNRGGPDPNPIPQPTPPLISFQESILPVPQPPADGHQQGPSSSNWLTPSGLGHSPSTRSRVLSRRASSPYATSCQSDSPALTQRSFASANRQSVTSPPSGSILGVLSDPEFGSRATSIAADGEDSSATFGQIHNVPWVVLGPKTTANPSMLERFPRSIFMRILMYCGYKDQVLLKKCSSSLRIAVDLQAIPWAEKTATILFEECYNPKNFNRAPLRTQPTLSDNKDGASEAQEAGRPKRGTKRRRAESETNADVSSPAPGPGQPRPHPESYNKWGCYSCYQILPAHYFEGALLEDKGGRAPKTNKLRGASAVESDKKVDMRVEYVQILEAIPGSSLPEWLSQDKMAVDAREIETYVPQRAKRGVNCDDLRAYYKDITKDSHLVAPIRGVTPAFTPLSVQIPKVNMAAVDRAHHSETARSPPPINTPLPAIQTREEKEEDLQSNNELSRPLYKLPGGNADQDDADNTSYTYELRIPSGIPQKDRAENPLTLPRTKPVSRVLLPPKTTKAVEPSLAPGDVVSLRRVCIPCGTKFAIYRRDCNRKIISKTDEQWWPCDCFEVRAAGKSTGCSTCGRKVIY